MSAIPYILILAFILLFWLFASILFPPLLPILIVLGSGFALAALGLFLAALGYHCYERSKRP